jgi:type IV secretory pathway VirB3-like protein
MPILILTQAAYILGFLYEMKSTAGMGTSSLYLLLLYLFLNLFVLYLLLYSFTNTCFNEKELGENWFSDRIA